MKIGEVFSPKRIAFIFLFSALVLVGSQINFSPLLGADSQFFTLFQFFGPIAGSFLGPFVGAASVLLAELANFVLVGKEMSAISLFRLAPMLLAAMYFGLKGTRWAMGAVPLLCMLAFWMHPVGAQAWFYALYWLIPLGAALMPDRLFLKSLGATFVAHAVGSTLFLYTVPTNAALWIALIPIVAYERGLFSIGISVSHIVMNTVLSRIESILPLDIIHIDRRYVLSTKTINPQPQVIK